VPLFVGRQQPWCTDALMLAHSSSTSCSTHGEELCSAACTAGPPGFRVYWRFSVVHSLVLQQRWATATAKPHIPSARWSTSHRLHFQTLAGRLCPDAARARERFSSPLVACLIFYHLPAIVGQIGQARRAGTGTAQESIAPERSSMWPIVPVPC
jgi:hypothetical protein